MQFHHINPENKKYQLSSGNCHNILDDLAESKKCLLVCANCHCEIHNGFYEGVDLWQYQKYDEEYAQSLLNNNSTIANKELICSDCGKPITIHSRSGKCASCVQKGGKRVINKPSKEELKHLIRTTTFLKIGEKYNISDNGIRKWCDAYNLPRTKREINSYSDEEWEKI